MPSATNKPREYEVYDAFLAHRYPAGFDKLVISCATVPVDPAPTEESVLSQLSKASADAWENFKSVCGQIQPLQWDFLERAACIQFTPQPASEAYGLEKIRADFPEGDGIVYLSRIGFSNDGRQALGVIDTFSHRAFPSVGSGFCMLAIFDSGRWQVAGEAMRWIA